LAPLPATPAVTCEGFRIVTGRPNLQANFIQQSSLMLALALGVESQCGPAVLADTDPAYFHCWDMASPEALSPGGDFVPDGEVNVLDYGRQVRLQNLTGLGVNTFMLLSQAGAVLTPSGALEGPSDCARRRRNLAATIVANWHVSCPSNLAANRCYYDCNEAPACLHSVAPVLSEVLSGGSWYRVQLPSGWTAFSLLFDVGMDECTSSAPSVMCVQLQINSTCDDENFAVSRSTRLVIAAPMRGADKCTSNSGVRYFVPSGASNNLDYHQAKPGGVFPGTWVETAAGILHLREWIAPPPSLVSPPSTGRQRCWCAVS